MDVVVDMVVGVDACGWDMLPWFDPLHVMRSKATVPLMLTKWLAIYFQSSGISEPLSVGWSSQTPVAAPSSVIWPSFKNAVRMFGSVKVVPFAYVPLIPGP